MNTTDEHLFKQLRTHISMNNAIAAKEVSEKLMKRGYNNPMQNNIVTDYNVVTGLKINIIPSDDTDYESDHYEPFEDDGAYAEEIED